MKKELIILAVLLILISGCAPKEKDIIEEKPEKDDIEQIPESVLQELCEKESWPPDCSMIPDPKGRRMCEKCKELMGEEIEEGLIKEEDITQLTFLDCLAADPDWSPDGSKLVFLGMEKDLSKGGLYVANSDGTEVTKVGSWERDHLFNPSWSPVSNKIACHGPSGGPGLGGDGLFLVDLDGDQTKRTQLTTQTIEHVSWNHDGKKIAYNVYNGAKSSSIWVMNSDGSGQIQLTTNEDGFCTGPSFSYDGSKIVYLKGFTTSVPGPKPKEAINEIWIMNSDGSNKHMIYAPGEGMQWIRERAWNREDKILFAKHLTNKAPQIWVINSDGTNPKCILDPEAGGIPIAIYDDPVWDNSGTKIAVTKVILSDESWQVATFSWKE